jgi:hypothetical protein
MNPGALGRSLVAVIILVASTAACSDPAPPEPEVASIVLSVADTSIRFRDRLVVKATPQGALGVPLVRAVTWTSVSPSLLAIERLGTNGDSARIRASGVGSGEIRVSAGSVTRSFQVTVQDTVFSVTVTPGALSLVAGDTLSYSATVTGPPNAVLRVRWDVSNATVLQPLSSLDSQIVRLQVRSAGSASVRATAVADTTKVASAAVTAQAGKLVFVTQPATAQREIPLGPVPTVEVQDAAGNRSARSASDITLQILGGACGAVVTGKSTVRASNGVATFPGVAVSARCPALVLSATATPTAASATTQPFGVTARGCDAVVPFSLTDTVTAVFESGDCVVMRAGRQVFAHTYTLTIPSSTPLVAFRLNTASSAFAPRVESYLWQQDPSTYWVDSLVGAGRLATSYWLPSGTHRFVVTSDSPNGTGAYSRTNDFNPELSNAPLGCVVATTVGVSIASGTGATGSADCTRPFVSRSGVSNGQHFLLYARAGIPVQVTMRPTFLTDGDAYLEVFDVTNTSSLTSANLVIFDDNSGGGRIGLDAQLTVQPAPHGRFILIRAARGGAVDLAFTLTIS